jgi:hypothetical protein
MNPNAIKAPTTTVRLVRDPQRGDVIDGGTAFFTRNLPLEN